MKNPAASYSPAFWRDSTIGNSVNFLIRSLTPQSAKALWRTGNVLAVAVQHVIPSKNLIFKMRPCLLLCLVLQPQKEGGWTITSPLVPELVTEIDELEHLHACVSDALGAVMELYQDMGKEFPANLRADDAGAPVWFESLIMAEG